jgi:hypothetical protein
MNHRHASGAMAVPATRRLATPASPRFKIALILLHILVAAGAVYEVLSIFGKDCGRIS